jgi:hypothetical protein
MLRRFNLLALALLLLAFSATALADVKVPDNVKKNNAKKADVESYMRISPDTDAKEAKLVIPREVWQQMKAGLDGDDSQRSTAAASVFGTSGVQTMMAGFFLSLAFAFGGIWLVRTRRQVARLGPAALCIVAFALCGAFASAAYANAGPPPVARSLTSKILIEDLQWWGATGQVKIEVSDEANMVTLVLPKPPKKDKESGE